MYRSTTVEYDSREKIIIIIIIIMYSLKPNICLKPMRHAIHRFQNWK